jgi:parallel beta-helix repeat protein
MSGLARCGQVAALTLTTVACSGSSPTVTIRTPTMPAAPHTRCDRYAAPHGTPGATGSHRDPYGSVQTLAENLAAGERGCLRAGVYPEDVTLRRGGTPSSPIHLSSAPGERATLKGIVAVTDSANDVELSSLRLEGPATGDTPSLQVNGDRIVLRGNSITNHHTGTCVILGGAFPRYGLAVDAVVDRNRIHDCGRLPRTNHDHGIYVEGTRGARITDNLIYANADYGVHLYPDADHSYVGHNVIEGNGGGVVVAGEAGGEYPGSYASDGNLIEGNVISGNAVKADLETNWDGRRGRSNVARRNCLGPAPGGISDVDEGLRLEGNVEAEPSYVNRVAGDLRLRAGQPCHRLGAGPRP